MRGLALFASGTLLVIGLVGNLVLPIIYDRSDTKMVHVISGSMEPTHMTRTTLIVDTTVDRTALPVGEVVTYMPSEGGTPITHRIVDQFTDDGGQLWYTTKGDNNEDADPKPVAPVNVIGTIKTDLDHVLTLPLVGEVDAGQWVTWTRSFEGRIITFGPTLLFFALGELAVLFAGSFLDPTARRRKREELEQDTEASEPAALKDPTDSPAGSETPFGRFQ